MIVGHDEGTVWSLTCETCPRTSASAVTIAGAVQLGTITTGIQSIGSYGTMIWWSITKQITSRVTIYRRFHTVGAVEGMGESKEMSHFMSNGVR